MKLFGALIETFIDLCEIPEMYAGIDTKTITFKIYPTPPCHYGVIMNCLDSFLANKLISHYGILITVMQRLNLAEIQINIRNRFFRLLSSYPSLFEAMKNLDVDLNSLYHRIDPVFIVAMHNYRLLFANPAALLANQKTPDEFIGENVAALSYPDEVEYRHRMLRLDGKLTNYEYKGMNWYNDDGIWRRKEMNFVVDFQKIDFCGVECRVGIDLMAEETRRFID